MEATNIEIQENTHNGGLCGYFNVGDQQYYADIASIFGAGNECMIFASKDHHVTDWLELYCNRNVLITEDCLRECIDDFVTNYLK